MENQEVEIYNSVSEYNKMANHETLHPLVSVIDFSKSDPICQHKRKFGFLTYEDNLNIKSLESLGVDPLTDDFNTEDFYKETSKSEKDIKDFLMAQNIVSGLGNIYVNEIMYLAGINPLTKMNTLSKKQVDNIVKITKDILKKSINLGGSSISDYVNADNEKGKFQNHFNVYKRSEDRFGNKVEKISQSGRATYYAPALQK